MGWASRLVSEAVQASRWFDARAGKVVNAADAAPSSELPDYYPALLEDLRLVSALLRDLQADLQAAPASAVRHEGAMERFTAALRIVDAGPAGYATADAFLDRLTILFEHLRIIEDELTSAPQTVDVHAVKLQHLDLAMQLLTEVVAAIVFTAEAHPLSAARLQNLRECCRLALAPDPAEAERRRRPVALHIV